LKQSAKRVKILANFFLPYATKFQASLTSFWGYTLGDYGMSKINRREKEVGLLQEILSKFQTYCVLKPTQPPTLSVTGND